MVPARRIRALSLVVAVSSLAALYAALGQQSPVAEAQAGDERAYLPLVMRRFEGPFPKAPAGATTVPEPTADATAGATAGTTAAATAMTAPPTTAPPTTAPTTAEPGTAEPTATGGPTPAPTAAGEAVRFPRNPDAIILQIGRTDTAQTTQVFEEMNGTPWFTLYGDGRVIAGRELFDNLQPLYVGTVDEDTLQRWLQRLTHDVGFHGLGTDYHHPRAATPEVHVFLFTNAGAKRVSLRSFKQFEQLGVPETVPEAERVQALVAFVRALEAELTAGAAPPSATPFAPDCYTVLAQQMYGFEHLTSQFKPWSHSLNVRTVAQAAPTAASNYIGRVVGHRFVNGELGREIQAVVEPQWLHWFPLESRGAPFSIGGRPYVVGARQEVPGGSRFLPNEGFDTRGSFWYRRDPGSGACPGLPRPLVLGGHMDLLGWRWRLPGGG